MPRPGRRDIELLSYIGDQYAISISQLARLIDRRPETARSLARRWQTLGWARVRTLIAREPALVWITQGGLRTCGLGYRRWEPSAGTAAHITAATEVRMFVERRRPNAVWLSERRLAHERPVSGHRPDAVVLAEGREVPVEVELTPKSPQRALEIATELVGFYGFAWYFVSKLARPGLERISAHFGDEVVQVFDLPQGT